jgi:FkbM family methyltransferase
VSWLTQTFLERLYGRRRFQAVFRRMQRGALIGLNYGVEDPAANGEYALLDRLAPSWPPTPTIFDVGAFHGDWSQAVLDRRPDATIFAFEPLEESHAAVAARLGERLSLYRCAIGSSTGEAVIYAPQSEPDWASLHTRDLSRFGRVADARGTVAVDTLDHFCEAHRIDHVHMVKIDTEGHELEVLRGAGALMARGALDVIQFEFGGTALDSRIFLRDLVGLLTPTYDVSRLLRDGTVPVTDDEIEEIFTYANYVAQRKR